MSDDLAGKVTLFCASLRAEGGLSIGTAETRDALRAIEIVGLRDRSRVRNALRAVCCGRLEDVDVFERAFNAFFSSGPAGSPQPQHAAQRGRADAGAHQRGPGEHSHPSPAPNAPTDEVVTFGDAPTELQPLDESAADAWQTLRARYSPDAAAAETPCLSAQGWDDGRREAARLVAAIELGRSQRWKPQAGGRRFDLRRTLRACLRTGGEAVELRMLGHPLRNPRFVVLIDGSRSMTEHSARILQFAAALCRRTRRASAFVFSTALREVTQELRRMRRGEAHPLEDLGPAWGGGTRIGENLDAFVRSHATRVCDQTFVFIFSDGLDSGNVALLRHAMRDLSRRSAAIAWINPHAGTPGYAPSALGMEAALPYVTLFAGLDELSTLDVRSA